MSGRSVALWFARLWARTYSLGVARDTRCARLQEIESDVWEWTHDTEVAPVTGRAVLQRTFAGAWADVRWRLEHGGSTDLGIASAAVVAAIAVKIALVAPPSPTSLLAVAIEVRHETALAEFAPSLVDRPPAVGGAAPRARRPRRPATETRPNLSGAWVMDDERSVSPTLASWDPRRIATSGRPLVLTQTATRFEWGSQAGAAAEPDPAFDLRGVVAIDHADGEQVVRTASWVARTLVTVTTRTSRAGSWTSTDLWTLSPSGDTLTVERVNQAGEHWATYRDRLPDAMRGRSRDVFTRAGTAAESGRAEGNSER